MSVPPHREIAVWKTCGYADKISTAAGDEISFKINSSNPLEIQIIRLGTEVDDTNSFQLLASYEVDHPAPQAVHPGSYVHVVKDPPHLGDSFTIELWLRPWLFSSETEHEWSSIVSNFDKPGACGFGLFLDRNLHLVFYVGDGRKFERRFALEGKRPITGGAWHHVVATFDHGLATLWVDDAAYAGGNLGTMVANTSDAPLRIGAAGYEGRADYFLDADVANIAIYSRAMASAAIVHRYDMARLELGVQPPYSGLKNIAFWDFAEDSGDVVIDRSGNGFDGTIINKATRMIGCPPLEHNHGAEPNYSPREDELSGHGIRFSSDDLLDCMWKDTLKFKIPESARSGYYAARLIDKRTHEVAYHITFVVRPKRKRSEIAVLASTNTWYAYNPEPNCGAIEQLGFRTSLYNRHENGCSNYYVGFMKPNPRADPYAFWMGNDVRYSHLVRGERFVQSWLEKNGYEYDLYTDMDLHYVEELLAGYKVLIISAHSEYWSTEMRAHLLSYLRRGGNVICLSGNTMYWRVSIKDGIMECRKFGGFSGDPNIIDSRRFGAEILHSLDGRPGGLLRNLGQPCHEVLGLETYGMLSSYSALKSDWKPYKVKRPDHFLFEGLNLKYDDEIGNTSLNGPSACGDEYDIAIASFPKAGSRKVLPAAPPGLEILAKVEFSPQEPKVGETIDIDGNDLKIRPKQGADLVYWERADGGKVLNAGSMSFGGSLHVDRNIDALLKNTLKHFGVAPA